MLLSERKYHKFIDSARKQYREFGAVACPALNGNSVYFSSKGFNHLLYKSKSKRRAIRDQFMRFKMLCLAKRIIEITTTFQEYDEITQQFLIKMNHKKKIVRKLTKYWGFVAIIGDKRPKIIIRKVGGGRYHFWSIIPQWKTVRLNNRYVRKFYSGNMQID